MNNTRIKINNLNKKISNKNGNLASWPKILGNFNWWPTARYRPYELFDDETALIGNDCEGAWHTGGSAQHGDEVDKWADFFGDLHELALVGHLGSRFFMTLPFSKGYPSIFVFESTYITPRLKERLNFLQRKLFSFSALQPLRSSR